MNESSANAAAAAQTIVPVRELSFRIAITQTPSAAQSTGTAYIPMPKMPKSRGTIAAMTPWDERGA